MKTPTHRIRFARRVAGMTQAQLAAKLGVSRSAVAQWERSDGSNPSAGNLASLALALNCSFEWLATGRGIRGPAVHKGARASEAPTKEHAHAHSDAEDHLLAVFRELDHWDQKAVTAMVVALSQRSRRSTRSQRTRRSGAGAA
jgi:transcriptional regulator with XRE-family HTH domain